MILKFFILFPEPDFNFFFRSLPNCFKNHITASFKDQNKISRTKNRSVLNNSALQVLRACQESPSLIPYAKKLSAGYLGYDHDNRAKNRQ